MFRRSVLDLASRNIRDLRALRWMWDRRCADGRQRQQQQERGM